jgi:hypothetical protein
MTKKNVEYSDIVHQEDGCLQLPVKEMGERVSKLYFGIFVQIYLVPGVL